MANVDKIEFSYRNREFELSLPKADHIGHTILETRAFYEQDLLSSLEDIPLPKGAIVDVGANVGNHTVFFAGVLDRKVIAFEPYPPAIELLEKNVKNNNLENLVEIRKIGLGDKKFQASGAPRIDRNLGSTALHPSECGDISVETLDSQSFGEPIAILKIDAEGMDVEILKGGERTIAQDTPIIFVEAATPESQTEISEFLSRLGYAPLGAFGATTTLVFFPVQKSLSQQTLIKYACKQITASQLSTLDIRKNIKMLNNTINKLGNADQELNENREFDMNNIQKNLKETHLRIDELESELSLLKTSHYRLTIARISSLEGALKEIATNQSSIENKLDAVEKKSRSALSGPLLRRIVKLQNLLRRIKRAILSKPAKQTPKLRAAAGQPGTATTAKRRSRMERGGRAKQALGISLTEDAKASVIMTAFNASAYVGRAIQSLRDQTYQNIEIIVVDDASTDDTLTQIMRFSANDTRIKVIGLKENRGTYWAKNVALLEATGDVVTFMDSDDLSVPDRIARQIAQLRDPSVVATICNCLRVNDSGDVVLNRGLRERTAPISLMLKRQVLVDIGYFDTVRTSADDEFQTRLRRSYPKGALKVLPEALYIASIHDASLSNDPDNSVDLTSEKRDFLSPARRSYLSNYVRWHDTIFSNGRRPYVPFPVTDRPFNLYPKLKIDGERFQNEPVSAFMATFPARRDELRLSVESLIGQVDHLYIYLNGYSDVPDFLKNQRITALPAADLEDLRDVGKFFHMSSAQPGYFFTVDDDIQYPSDYVERIIQTIERYNRRVVVGVHGMIFSDPLERFFSPNRQVFSFKHSLAQDRRVNALGTGTVAFHSSTLTVDESALSAKGMADVWLAIAAKKQSAPMISLQRPGAWLNPITSGDDIGPTLFSEFHKNDEIQTSLLKAAGDWSLTDELPDRIW